MARYTTPATAIDLMVTDLFLPPSDFQLISSKNQYPRVNGHDLVQQVLSIKHELCVMSSHTLISLAAQGITINPNRFLHKPFAVKQLLTPVAAALTAPTLSRIHSVGASIKDVLWFD
jgi:DNA-binding NtrC family response regulator